MKLTWVTGDTELIKTATGRRGTYKIEQFGRRYLLTAHHFDGLAMLQINPPDGMAFDGLFMAMRRADRIDGMTEGEASGS